MSTNTDFQVGVIRPVECFQEGWELIKDRFWLFVGAVFIGGVLAGFSMYLLLGAMFCGIYYCLFKQVNREPISLGDLFKGFDYFVPSLIVSLFFIVPNLLITFLNFGFQIAVPIIFKETGAKPEIIWTVFGFYAVIIFILGIIMACVHALIMFAFPLIVERKLSGLDALKLSARSVWANLGGVVGLILCEYLLFFLGFLACFVGVILVAPIIYAGTFIAYRKVFPSFESPFYSPPPPPNFANRGF